MQVLPIKAEQTPTLKKEENMFPETTLSIYQTTAITRKTTVRFLAVIRTSTVIGH